LTLRSRWWQHCYRLQWRSEWSLWSSGKWRLALVRRASCFCATKTVRTTWKGYTDRSGHWSTCSKCAERAQCREWGDYFFEKSLFNILCFIEHPIGNKARFDHLRPLWDRNWRRSFQVCPMPRLWLVQNVWRSTRSWSAPNVAHSFAAGFVVEGEPFLLSPPYSNNAIIFPDVLQSGYNHSPGDWCYSKPAKFGQSWRDGDVIFEATWYGFIEKFKLFIGMFQIQVWMPISKSDRHVRRITCHRLVIPTKRWLQPTPVRWTTFWNLL